MKTMRGYHVENYSKILVMVGGALHHRDCRVLDVEHSAV